MQDSHSKATRGAMAPNESVTRYRADGNPKRATWPKTLGIVIVRRSPAS